MIHNKRSIKTRLFFIIMLTSTIVLLVAGLLFIAFRMVQLKQDMTNSLTIQAGVIADNAQAIIVFEDKYEANKLLGSLKYDPQVIYALLLNDEKQVLAHYQRPNSNLPTAPMAVGEFLTEKPVFRETEHYLIHARPIYSQANKIGHVVLYADFSRYLQLLTRSALMVAIVIMLALFVALFLSYILQKLISKPIESLANFVSNVTEGQNYELRTENKSYAEIEKLAVAFNQLLEQIHRAISARDQAQHQLRTYSFQLEDLVYQRTRQLEEAKEAAEASSRAKSAFLANMSHEIRTPMNAIVVFTRLALNASESPHQQQQLKRALESADLLLALIDDLLDFSRIDANKMELDYQNCDLFEILASINQMLTVKYIEKGLEFIIDVSETVPRHILIDSLRLKQVLINLLTNAIKFTEAGQVRLSISASMADSTPQMTFSISDTGIGMDRETIARIFEVFSQGDVSTTRKYGGTGLGLSISKKLVALMGGNLSVDSQPGRGSQFSFSLPLDTSSTKDSKAVTARTAPRPDVMVVEPRQQSREHLLKLLQSLGCSVDSAETGNRALILLAQRHGHDGHLLISRNLQDTDAFALVRQIRAEPQLANVSISLMDSLLGEQAIKQFSETEAPVSYLKTPVFDRALLYQHLMHNQQETEPRILPQSRRPAQTRRLSSVLIVDDYYINRLLIMDVLQDRAERFLEAGNGREALEILQKEKVDLVLMDIQMPEMDGFEATRQIRRQLRLTALPIIGMTAFAAESDCRQCYQAGMNDVLIKPIDIDQLKKLFNQLDKDQSKLATGDNSTRLKLSDYPLPGIDIESGLSRLHSDEEKYKKLLVLFYNSYQGKESLLEGYLEQGNWAAAESWLHSLKGVCANLSISSVNDCCVKLYEQLKNRSVDQQDLQHFRHRFTEVIQSLQRLAEPGT